MIVSASRRTDIPAFYSEWFLQRLKDGYVDSQNPLNPKQIRRVPLTPDGVDCIVFWTKNAAPMGERLKDIDAMGYAYYFQWTLTPYGKGVEPGLPDKQKLVDSFKALSERIGSQRVIWRYDPILLSRSFPMEYHLEEFSRLARALGGYTDTCVISFYSPYAKTRKRMKPWMEGLPDEASKVRLAAGLAEAAWGSGIALRACCEAVNLKPLGIGPAACIDGKVIGKILGRPIDAKKAKAQRDLCGCIESVDIGAYDSCLHGCAYCYAVRGEEAVLRNRGRHDVHSPLLIGRSS